MQSGASRPRAMGSREWYFIPRGCKTCNEVVELYSIKNKRKRKSTQTRSSMTHTTQPGCGSDGDGERVLLSGTVRGTWTRGAERARHRLLPARLLLALRAAAPPSIALTLDRRCLASVSLAPLASLATSSMSSCRHLSAHRRPLMRALRESIAAAMVVRSVARCLARSLRRIRR